MSIYQNSISIQDAVTDIDPRVAKLGDRIQQGFSDSAYFFEELERRAPRDFIVGTRGLDFHIEGKSLFVDSPSHSWKLHKNAVSQMVGRTGILTQGVAAKMMEAGDQDHRWGQELLLDSLRKIFQNTQAQKVLVRTVEGVALAFLSDRYRRMSCGPIFQEFSQAAGAYDAVPVRMSRANFMSHYMTDVKVGFSLYLPHVFRPIANRQSEAIIIGIMVENSDFGCGALSVSLVMDRIWCSNLMVTSDELRKIHLGSRLSENFVFSQQTHDADTTAMALQVGDIVKNLFAPEYINQYTGRIGKAAETVIDPAHLFAEMRSKNLLTKGEESAVTETFNEADVEMMPAGNNVWRAANAVSLFANRIASENPDRAVELHHAAGRALEIAI